MSLPPRVSAIAASLREDRATRRRSAFASATVQHESCSRRSGAHILGMDEKGKVKDTRKITEFPIFVAAWRVRLGFKREDREKLNDSWKEVEARLKQGDVPRKIVKFDTHIVTAVRALKHVREGYQNEVEKTERVLQALDTLNVWIAEVKRGHSDKDIDTAIAELKLFDASDLAKKQVAIKRIVARARLSETVRMFEEAKQMPASSKRDLQVSRACAVFSSLRARLGQWRDKQIAGLVEYTHEKECALRVERDRWLFSQLSRFAEIPATIHEHCTNDLHKIETLNQVRDLLRRRRPKKEILEFIVENHGSFKSPGKQRVDIPEDSIHEKDRRVDYLIGHYGWLYRYINRGERDKARAKLDYLVLFINADKPRFVLEELGKDRDSYLTPAIEELEKAVAAFEAKNFSTARMHFLNTRDHLRAVYLP